MKKILLFILLLTFSKGFCQSNSSNINNTILKSSSIYLNKALWFQEMPQYNSDSSNYYFEKATKQFLVNSTIYGLQLAQIYFHKCSISAINNSFEVLDSLANIGWSYFVKSPQKNDNQQFEYDFLTNWSSIKREKGDTKESLNLFSKAIQLGSDFKTDEQKAKVFADKGIFYERHKLVNEQKLGLTYLIKSCNFYEEIGIEKKPMELSRIYAAIIGYYSDINTDSLFHYSAKLQKILKYLKKPQKHAWYYVTAGRDLITYPLNGAKKIPAEQFNKGKAYIIHALDILEKYKIYKNTIRPYAYGLLADIYLNEKKYDLAIINYKKSNQGYLLLKNRSGALDMNLYIAEAYQKKGDLATALAYFKQYNTASINLEKERNERGLRESELQVNLLQQDKEINKERKQQYLYLILLFVALGLFALLFWNYEQKQKSNKQLAVLNNDLAAKNSLLDKRNADIELLLKEIHHRVKNNLEVVSSLLALQSAQISDPNTKDAMTEGQNRVNSIGIVHQKLYQGTNLGSVEMKDYFLNLSESILDSFGAEQRINLKLAMENLDLDIDTAVPLGLIVNELLTNCIKYAFPNGEKGIITIKLHKTNNTTLRLEVADNGVGKSGVTQGTGFGAQLISLLTQQLNGSITEESLNGTKLIFDFKVKAA
jgi:two-component system, sensor histidine kinase PdtaS